MKFAAEGGPDETLHQTRRRYPRAPRQDLSEERHGLVVTDPYRWLEDPGSPETTEWIAGQDRLFEAERSQWQNAGGWHAQVTTLADTEKRSVPLYRCERLFYLRREAGAEHAVLLVSEKGTQRPLLDPVALDPTGRTTVDRVVPSLDGRLVACQTSANGTEDSLLHVLDVTTGETIDGPVDRVRRSPIAWLPDSKAFYYVRRLPPGLHPGEERYHRRVYLHRLGADPDDDTLIFGDGRAKSQFYSLNLTPDGRWLAVTASDGTDSVTEVFLADLWSNPPDRPAFTQVRQELPGGTRVRIEPGTEPGDPIWFYTTSGAPRGQVVTTTAGSPGSETWRELISQSPDAVMTDFAVLTGPELAPPGGPLGLAVWTRRAIAAITVHDLTDGRCLGTVPLPGDGQVGSLSVPPDRRYQAWFSYTDYVTDQLILCFDGRTGQVSSLPPGRSASGHAGDAGGPQSPPQVRQVRCVSRDGSVVRIFVISMEGRPDQPRPAILTGYGGFGVSMSPAFAPDALAWVRAGGVYAVACLRGGGEEGEDWHRAGQGAFKQNVFDDFDAVTDTLVADGWTTPRQLGIVGSSNGGLLVGAALTQHPEKYGAAVCIAPLLDMIRYELSGLGQNWRREYGSASDPEQFRTLLSYSPYHHVTAGTRYPPTLLAAFDGDSRVDPLHARKMCAALQHASPRDGSVLLRLERGVGHGSRAASRETALQADCLAFFSYYLGLPAPVAVQ